MDTAAKEQKRLDKITVNQPDCLLLDNMMSVTDGLQTLEILRDRNFIVPINPTADIQECLKTRSLEVCATKIFEQTHQTRPIT